jgi:hypothetical protein
MSSFLVSQIAFIDASFTQVPDADAAKHVPHFLINLHPKRKHNLEYTCNSA